MKNTHGTPTRSSDKVLSPQDRMGLGSLLAPWIGASAPWLGALQSKGLSRVFSNTTVQKHPFFNPCAGAVLSLAQTHRGGPQTTSTRLYAGGELQGSPVWQAPAGHKRSFPLAVVLPPPARGPGTLISSAQRLVWAAKPLKFRAPYPKSVSPSLTFSSTFLLASPGP